MGAEIRSTINGTIEFSALNRELSIPIDISRLRNLLDIQLQFYIAPTVMPLINSAQNTGGEDFRFYINEHNVTTEVSEEIGQLISTYDHEHLKTAYLKGANAYLNYASSMGLPSDQVEEDRRVALEVANDQDWPSKFTELGNRNIGWSGNLHCLNFLYRFIPLSPISLNSIWRQFKDKSTDTLPSELSDFSHLICTLSQGGAPSFEVFDPITTIPSGRIVYLLELLHKNPLEPRLRQVTSKLKTISKLLEIQRVDYLTPIKSGVETAKEDISHGNNETKVALDRLTSAVKNIG